MSEYLVRVSNSNFFDISTGQQKFMILSDRRDPIIGDILVISNRNYPGESVKAIITSFEIDANGIESGFVIVSIDLDLQSKETIMSQAEINNKINILEKEKKSLLDTIATIDKEKKVINQTNDNNELSEKYNSLCNRYNELDASNITLKKQYHELSKKLDSADNKISELTTENSKKKNELSRQHNSIEDFKFQLDSFKNEKNKLIKLNNELTKSNESLTIKMNKLENNKNNKDIELKPVSDGYMQLKTLTKNLLVYIDNNL